ncbi:MAG: serine/threonine-protein phosphatase [Ignavibacteriae bacterium]|nr:serine/threonine-protein phosphatase [Ignavibacteriota bacterium]MCB9243164.1 serine/threonine-protein phosphatase [Ignavibacteriales bacterium]
MEQKRLYKTIETISKDAPKFKSDEELLCHVLGEIIKSEEIEIIGGRVWKLTPEKDAYVLIQQMGDVEPIEDDYKIAIRDYPIVREIGKKRSVIAKETDDYLIKKGIYHYSATGVGERYKIRFLDEDEDKSYLYEYLIALNAKQLGNDLLDTLNIISTTLSSILKTRDIESEAKTNIVELEKAREIQRNILPEHEMSFGNYEMFGVSIPENIVGGDFFDYLKSEDSDILGVAIADAASKGISAAAQSLYVSGALKMGVEFDIKMTSLIKKVNRLIYELFPFERFVTLFYCELFKDTKGLCIYVNAGHNRPLFYKSETGSVSELATTGPVLGPSPEQEYFYESILIKKNDVLILYTDGIVEAMDSKYELYGEERLKNVILKNAEKSPKELCNAIIEDVQIYSAGGEYADDKTLVVIKRVN